MVGSAKILKFQDPARNKAGEKSVVEKEGNAPLE
jgi:hypothetical protein